MSEESVQQCAAEIKWILLTVSPRMRTMGNLVVKLLS